jgi:hypothetical protein
MEFFLKLIKKSIQEYKSNQINDNTTVEIKKNTLTLILLHSME